MNPSGVKSLGEAIIIKSLSSALYSLVTTSTYVTQRLMESQASLRFIQSRELDNTIETFCLDIDADTLRVGFFSHFRIIFRKEVKDE